MSETSYVLTEDVDSIFMYQILYDFSYMRNLEKIFKKTQKTKLIDTENRLVTARDRGEG